MTCRTEREYGRKEGSLIVQNILNKTRIPVEFSTGVTPVFM
jgi:hypothetical protein